MSRRLKNEIDLRRFKNDIINFKAGEKSKVGCLVPFIWYADLCKWLERYKSDPPGKLNNLVLLKGNKFNSKLKYGIDFAVIDPNCWDLIVENFGKTQKIGCYFVLNPENKEPCAIINGINLEIEVEGVRKIKKMSHPSWKIGPLLKQLCTAMKIERSDYSLFSPNYKEIKDDATVKSINENFPGVLLFNKVKRGQHSSKSSSLSSIKNQTPEVNTKTTEIHEKTFQNSRENQNIYFIPSDECPQIHKNSSLATERHLLPSEKRLSDEISFYSLFSKQNTHESQLTEGKIKSAIPQPIGFTNIGNTCYFNSAVQCLIRVQKLTDFILSDKFESSLNTTNKEGSGGRIAKSYRHLLYKVCNSKTATYMSPEDLWEAIAYKYKRFNNYRQHDSQELLGSLLDGLHEDMKQKNSSSQIIEVFGGEYVNEIVCPLCRKSEINHEKFLFLSLAIPDQATSCTLLKCISNFSAPEILDKNNKWLCNHCKKEVQASKSMRINKLPQTLIIHLKRFNFANSKKISTNIEYPDILEANKFVSQSGNAKYKLIGVVMHSGSLSSGHYTATALTSATNKWYHYNDSMVNEVSQTFSHSNDAYLLFYQRI